MEKYPSQQPPPYSATSPPAFGFQVPQGPPQTMAAQTTVVTVPQTTINFGPQSQRCVCPYCHHDISTKIENKATTKTHCMAVFLCLFLCWPCVCLPYCMDSCQNKNHYCPKCGAYLGTYES